MDVAINILYFISGMLTLYLTAYIKVKGKNKALVEDIIKLESEKQKIIAKYTAETESLKKKHTLEIEKRKFKYEEKRKQFARFFGQLDEFNRKSQNDFYDVINTASNSMLEVFLSGSEQESNEALLQFSQEIQATVFVINEEHMKLLNEQNSLKLIASQEIELLLHKLEIVVKKDTAILNEMMKAMLSKEFQLDQSSITPLQDEATESSVLVKRYRDEIMRQMKRELDEI